MSSLNCFNKLSHASCDNSVSLGSMIPVSHAPIAVSEKKISIEICPDDADFLSAPPWSLQGSPVLLSDENSDCDRAGAVPKCSMRPQTANRTVDRIGLLHHGYLCSIKKSA